jgi:methylase of polypeptide subunit release factors
MTDILGKAMWDYYDSDKESVLWVHDVIGPKVEMPVAIYFRDYAEMPAMEQLALMQCYGKVLDVGAGAGSHAMALEMRGLHVDALDISPLAVKTMKSRGADNAICGDIFEYQKGTYDTILMLMNGIGFCGTVDKLYLFLNHAKSLLL